jgi:xylan 1,4-beta-xylosidase
MRLGSSTVAAVVAATALAAAGPAAAQLPIFGGGEIHEEDGAPPGAIRYSNPVLPGDYPDPSVLRDGANYWAVTTSGGWSPPFTMLTSRDLVNWVVAGSVLRKRPSWASGDFWAPEIVKSGQGYLVYYSARRRHGNFCVGVASAPAPTSFFRDRGPIACPRLGAIDPLPVWDAAGKPFLVWKEDGNAHRRPTPIMAAPLAPGGLRVAGPKHELFRNDKPWEGRVVEGPAMTRHNGKLYMFYSARSCCGRGCNYVMGVARSPTLLGPWEKRDGPILSGGDSFRCPGHGTVVDGPDGSQYLLYHAYSEAGSTAVGRQVLLDRLVWGPDGWPAVAHNGVPTLRALSPLSVPQQPRPQPFTDDFQGRFLTAGWNWNSARPVMHVDGRAGGRLWLAPPRNRTEGAVGRQPGVQTWTAETDIGGRRGGASAGIAAFADPEHALGVEVRGSRAVAWRREGSATITLGALPVGSHRFESLRIVAEPGVQYSFAVRSGSGWARVAGPYPAPRWRGETRVVLRVAGGRRAHAAFERFSLGPLGS